MRQGIVMRVLPGLLACLAILVPAAPPAGAADPPLAEPRPSWEAPRKILLQLTTDDPRHVNSVLSNAVNLQKFYGQDNVKVAILAYGAGVRAMLREGAPAAERVASLRDYEVEFLACGNTLDAIGKTPADLLPGVAVVTAGIAEIVERTLKGWHYVVP